MKKKLFFVIVFFLLVANLLVGHLLLVKKSEKYSAFVTSVASLWQRPKVKIFVTYYKPYKIFEKNKVLEPIQVGRAIEREPFMGGELANEDVMWLHEHMMGDDTGDNISEKNREFDVLTAYYWVWKHYKEIGNPQYIGFFAHRKYLYLRLGAFSMPNELKSDYGYDEEKMFALLEKHEVIANYWIPYSMQGSKQVGMSFYENYKTDHHVEDIDFMVEFVKKNYPEMVPAMNEVLYNVGQAYSVWNFWIMRKDLAFDYFEKLFPLMFALEKERGKIIAQYDLKQRRAFGYLAERFFAVWLVYQQKTGRVSKPYMAPVFYL